jgi:hypothetical protein
MPQHTPEELYHRLDELGEDWAVKDAEWKAKDAATKSVLALCMDKVNEQTSMAAKESRARNDPQFLKHQDDVKTAHLEAVKARVNYDNYRTYVDLLRTKAANRRAEMNLR